MERLFVYGTLLKGIKGDVFQDVESSLKFESDGCIKGELFDLGEYPAVIEGKKNSDIVRGEVYSVEDYDKVFSILDEYEGLHDRDPEYRRKKKLITLSTGKNVRGWVYIYVKPVDKHNKRIESGDYLAFIKRKNNK